MHVCKLEGIFKRQSRVDHKLTDLPVVIEALIIESFLVQEIYLRDGWVIQILLQGPTHIRRQVGLRSTEMLRNERQP
jgi:hypothetical protein